MVEMIESFKRDLAEVCWQDLRIHLQRDAIILVAADLDIIQVAVAVAEDDSRQVEAWITSGEIGKPSRQQLDEWEQDLEKPFRMLIVQPFILVQGIPDA
jgi:hypothetical protein